jgi:hypothetical protein
VCVAVYLARWFRKVFSREILFQGIEFNRSHLKNSLPFALRRSRLRRSTTPYGRRLDSSRSTDP